MLHGPCGSGNGPDEVFGRLLFGDTGEKDPEVYHTLMQERPGTVGAVFIHNVTDANPQDARFAGFTLFSDWSEVLQATQQRNLGLLQGIP